MGGTGFRSCLQAVARLGRGAAFEFSTELTTSEESEGPAINNSLGWGAPRLLWARGSFPALDCDRVSNCSLEVRGAETSNLDLHPTRIVLWRLRGVSKMEV